MIGAGRWRFQTKVSIHAMLTALIALVMVGVAFVTYDRLNTEQSIVQGMYSDADNIASASTAALQFDDFNTLEENLAILRHQPHVVVAGIYSESDRVAAVFTRKGQTPPLPTSVGAEGERYIDNDIVVVRPIRLPDDRAAAEGKVVGHVYIRRDLSDLRERLWQYIGIVTAVLASALIITIVTTRRFTEVLTRPIDELVETAERVAETQDFALRARKLTEDELGKLTETFNQMLAQIEQRDAVVRDREHRFTSYMDNSPAVAWMKDEDFRYVYINDTFKSRFDLEDDAAWRGKSDFELFPQEAAESIRENDRVAIEGDQTIERQEAVPTPDGRDREWMVVKFPFTDENGRRYVGGMAFEITERVEAQHQLENSEALYRSLVEHVPQAIFRKDLDGRITFANQLTCELIGKPMEEVIGATDSELFPPELAERFAEQDRQVIEHGVLIDIDDELTGEIFSRVLHTIKTPLHDADGNIIGIQGIAWDVTERRRALEALQRSERELAKAQAIAHLGSWTWSPATGEVTLSDELRQIYGLEPGQFDGTFEYLLDHVIHPEDRDIVVESSKRGAMGETSPAEFRVVHPDGSIRVVVGEGETILDEDGNVMQLFGTAQDITERKEAEEALRRSEEKYRRIVETAQEGIWVLDSEARTSFVNPRMAEMLGYTVGEMLGKPMYDFMDERARVEAEENWGKRRSGVSEQHAFRFRHKAGRDVWTTVSANPLTDDDGAFVGALGMITDVTEQRQAEAAIKELEQRLHTVVANTPIVLFATNAQGEFLLSEGKGLESLGLAPGEVVGRDAFEIYADSPDVVDGIRRALAGEAHTAVVSMAEQYFETRYSPLYEGDREDDVIGVIGVAINITDRMQTEAALRESELLNRRIVENVPGGIVRVDIDGSVVHANTEAQAFLGLKRDELANTYISAWKSRTVLEGGAPCEPEDYPVSRCLATGETQPPMTIGVHGPDGSLRWGVFTAVPLFEPQTRQLTGAVVTFLDITDRKRTEEELKYHVDFERLMTSISTDLLNLEPDQIDAAVCDSLRRIGNFVGVDRCYILIFDQDTQRWVVEEQYQWVNAEAGVDAPMRHSIQPSEVPWATERSLDGQVIQISKLDDLPEEAASEKQRWQQQGIRSLFSVPIFSSGRVFGVMGLEAVRNERALSDDAITLLQIAGENFANALQRKQTEQSLRESQRMLSTLMSNLPGMAYRCRNDTDWTMEFVSEGALSLTGYTPKELTSGEYTFGRHITHPDDRDPVWSTVQDALDRRRAFRLIYRIVTRDGKVRWVWEQGRGIYSDDGDVVALEGFLTDISERRQAEQALRNSERRLELVLEATNEGVWDWNLETGEVHYSRRWIESLGYDPEEVTPHIDFWDSIIHPEDKPIVDAALRDHFEGRTPIYQCENRLRMKDGRYRWNHDRGKVVKWTSSGEPIRMVGTDTDITARKEAERAKATLEAELRQAQKLEAVGTLASGIAHDFSNLLTALYGYIEDAREAQDADEFRNNIKMIEKVADEASGVTRSLLTFTHKAPVEKSTVNIAGVVEGAMHLLRRVLPASVRIHTDLQDQDSVWVSGDAAQLQQIVMNLAINARDAMPDGGNLTLTVRCTAGVLGEAEQVEMIVEDSGVGMDEKILSRVFEPFFTTKARGKGTGLGLSIIHGIVIDHGGRVDVESTPGEGSKFIISLPAVAPPPDAEPRAAEPADRRAGHDELILLAEDNDFVRELTVTALEDAGYRVIAADNAERIVKAFEKQPDDVRLVILDVDLPDMTGTAGLRKIHETDADVPAIVVTGRVDQLDSETLADHVRVLAKPFQMPTLIELIHQTLQHRPRVEAES